MVNQKRLSFNFIKIDPAWNCLFSMMERNLALARTTVRAWGCELWNTARVQSAESVCLARGLWGGRKFSASFRLVRSVVSSMSRTMEKKKVYLVDDHPMVRERLGEMINRESDLIVCGEAVDGP